MISFNFELDSYMIEQIDEKIKELRERFGPERSVGPVTFEYVGGEEIRIFIATRKQGSMIDDIAWYPVTWSRSRDDLD